MKRLSSVIENAVNRGYHIHIFESPSDNAICLRAVREGLTQQYIVSNFELSHLHDEAGVERTFCAIIEDITGITREATYATN